MFSFFPQIIILLSLVGIIIIIARKIPTLAEAEERELRQAPVVSRDVLKERTKILGRTVKNFCLFVFKNILTWAIRIKSIFKETGKAPHVVQKQLKPLTARKPRSVQVKKQEVPETQTEIDPLILLNKASDLVENDKLDEAEKIYIEIIKKNPQSIRAYRALGEIYLKRHNFGDAKAAFRQVKKLNPNDKEALAQLRKLGEATEEAVEKIEEK